jgi:protein-disulfide isomerase
MSKDSKRGAREKLAEERRRDAAAAQRRQRLTNVVVAVVVVAVVVGIFIAVQSTRNSGPSDAALPAGITEPGAGAAFGDGPVTVDLWEDFQCPACKAFESVNAESLDKRVAAGDITLVIHPLSFLDQNLGNDSSLLAASAFGCAIDAGKGLEFHNTVYENQPAENPGQDAWTASDLVGWGNQVGITGGDWETCVNEVTYRGWAEQVASSQTDAGVTSTPTVFVDGTAAWKSGGDSGPFFTSPDALNALIDSASQG